MASALSLDQAVWVRALGNPSQNLEPYDYRADSLTYKMNRSSLHTRSFRRIRFSIFRYR